MIPAGDALTILIVEDEPNLRVAASAILRQRGYRVLAASQGDEALTLVEAHEGDIHLLLTDVMLPGMRGPDLARAVGAARPEVRTLFVSGYTADVLADRGFAEVAPALLVKPFTADDLALRVREILES